LYVKRARPTGLYIFYLVTVVLVVAIVFKVEVSVPDVLALTGPLAGYGSWYAFNRSQDKKNGR
jgi:hypothetical protein